MSHAARGQFRQAGDDFTEALRLDPTLVPAWVNRGLALEQLGDREGAAGAFQSALSRDESNQAAREGLARVQGTAAPPANRGGLFGGLFGGR